MDMRILGTPVGTAAYVHAHALGRLEEEKRLLRELPELPDLHCAWLPLHCPAASRANHLLRVVPPRGAGPRPRWSPNGSGRRYIHARFHKVTGYHAVGECFALWLSTIPLSQAPGLVAG